MCHQCSTLAALLDPWSLYLIYFLRVKAGGVRVSLPCPERTFVAKFTSSEKSSKNQKSPFLCTGHLSCGDAYHMLGSQRKQLVPSQEALCHLPSVLGVDAAFVRTTLPALSTASSPVSLGILVNELIQQAVP